MNSIYRVLGLFPARLPDCQWNRALHGLFCSLVFDAHTVSVTVRTICICSRFTNPPASSDELLLDSFLYFYRSVITCVSCHMCVAPPLVSYVSKQNLCPLQSLSSCSTCPALPAPHPPLEDMVLTLIPDGRGWVFTVHAFALIRAEGLSPNMDPKTFCVHFENSAVTFAFKEYKFTTAKGC